MTHIFFTRLPCWIYLCRCNFIYVSNCISFKHSWTTDDSSRPKFNHVLPLYPHISLFLYKSVKNKTAKEWQLHFFYLQSKIRLTFFLVYRQSRQIWCLQVVHDIIIFDRVNRTKNVSWQFFVLSLLWLTLDVTATKWIITKL